MEKMPKHRVRIGRLVGGDDLGLRAGVDVDQGVQDVQRVARRAGHDHLPDPHHLIIYCVEECEAAFVSEVLGGEGGVAGLADQQRYQGSGQVVHAGGHLGQVHVGVQEPGPGVHLQ
jgi:hypothetical protein